MKKTILFLSLFLMTACSEAPAVSSQVSVAEPAALAETYELTLLRNNISVNGCSLGAARIAPADHLSYAQAVAFAEDAMVYYPWIRDIDEDHFVNAGNEQLYVIVTGSPEATVTIDDKAFNGEPLLAALDAQTDIEVTAGDETFSYSLYYNTDTGFIEVLGDDIIYDFTLSDDEPYSYESEADIDELIARVEAIGKAIDEGMTLDLAGYESQTDGTLLHLYTLGSWQDETYIVEHWYAVNEDRTVFYETESPEQGWTEITDLKGE
ncbi:MAG: hypothetical protein IKD69_13180 [Solobacterium sp.]|nr:hypothetical protein [Solobacterium sp.]